MRIKNFKTTTFRKLDVKLEKTRDIRILDWLLHDTCFTLDKIRYSRKQLVIPMIRCTGEWQRDGIPFDGYVNGELILYPVIKPCDWQITLSGEWLNHQEKLQKIDIIGAKLSRKTDENKNCVEGLKGEFWYHFRLELYNHMLPCYLDVLLRDWKDFPLIRYRDVSMPYDYETREPIHLQYNKSRGKFQYGYHDYT